MDLAPQVFRMNLGTAFLGPLQLALALAQGPSIDVASEAQAGLTGYARDLLYSHYQFFFGTSLPTPPGLAIARGQHK